MGLSKWTGGRRAGAPLRRLSIAYSAFTSSGTAMNRSASSP